MRKGLKWVIGVGIVCALVVIATQFSWQRNDPTETQLSLLDHDMAGNASEQAVMWMFENQGCADCHGFNTAGLFGLNRQGQVLAQGFEGCAAMLDRVKETLVMSEADWTETQRTVRSDFELFGCTTCHQIGERTLAITEIGAQAGSILHGFCTDLCCPPEAMMFSPSQSE